MAIIIDNETMTFVSEWSSNKSMTMDEILNQLEITVDDENQLINSNGEYLNAWYENLEIHHEFTVVEIYSTDEYTFEFDTLEQAKKFYIEQEYINNRDKNKCKEMHIVNTLDFISGNYDYLE